MSKLEIWEFMDHLSESYITDIVETLQPSLVQPIGTHHGHNIAEKLSTIPGDVRESLLVFWLAPALVAFFALPLTTIVNDLVAVWLLAGGVPHCIRLHENDGHAGREVLGIVICTKLRSLDV
jgi:hypothetical protein